jgi:arabinose-5-phosphate isomerase
MRKLSQIHSLFSQRIFKDYLKELSRLSQNLDYNYDFIVNKIISIKGKLVFSSVGKSLHISKKISSSLSSLGKPSIAIHATELLHGDLGFVSKTDALVLLSHSGESDEVVKLSSISKSLGITVISITGNPKSTLSKSSQFNFSYPPIKEMALNGLAPTTSSTMMLILGDLITISIEKATNFSVKDYSKLHPLGAIGKSNSTLVSEIMLKSQLNPILNSRDTIDSCLKLITKFKLGLVFIVDQGKLTGLVTDGDIRRYLSNNTFTKETIINKLMNTNFKSILDNQTLLDANLIMIESKPFIKVLPVIDKESNFLGSLSLDSFLNNGVKFITND